MIVRAPCFVYPRTVHGFFDDAPGVASRPNYQIGDIKRRARFADLVDAGTETEPAGRPFIVTPPEPGGFGYDQDANCDTYLGVRKPSYVSAGFYFEFKVGSPECKPSADGHELKTDFRLIGFDAKETKIRVEQWLGRTYVDDDNRWMLIALGTWFQVRISDWATNIGGNLFAYTIYLTSERECRMYVEKCTLPLNEGPTFAFKGGGQLFPVIAETNTSAGLSLSSGGVIVRGAGSTPVQAIIGRNSFISSDKRLYIRLDVEVPYGI